MEILEQKLAELQVDLKAKFDKAADETKTFGTVLSDTKAIIAAIQTQVDAIDAKLVERNNNDVSSNRTVVDDLKENESLQRMLRDRTGRAVIELSGKSVSDLLDRKTTITSTAVGASTTGVLTIDRYAGITHEARQSLRVRDVLSASPTTQQVIDYVKVNSAMTRTSSPQVETAVKFEEAVTFTTSSERVKTLAAWIPATRQILDDFSELSQFLQETLPYYVNLEEEMQLLSGDGTGENLNGLVTVATAFSTGLLKNVGWTKIDIVGRAVQQVAAAKEVAPTFAIVNTNDWYDMRMTKDSYGRYILGDPQANVSPNLWGLTVVPTTSITSGTFLVGSGNPVATEIRDRMGMQVEISTEHSDYFTRNMVAIRAEKRLALVTRRRASFITGSFTTSPSNG